MRSCMLSRLHPVLLLSRHRHRHRPRPFYSYWTSTRLLLRSSEEATASATAAADAAIHNIAANPSLVDSTLAPSNYCPTSAVVYENAVTEQEAKSLVQDIESRMKRRRYEKGHWDAVITQYKEIELPLPSENPNSPSLSDESIQAIERIRHQLETQHFGPKGAADESGWTKDDADLKWISCHGIDLKKEGQLTAHVDSVRYSGLIVAGLSLLSSSIMRLRPAAEMDTSEYDDASRGENANKSHLYEPKPVEAKDDGHVDLYLPPLSLYVLSGVSRYRYTHELLPCGSTFAMQDESGKSVEVARDRRISVIFRDTKDNE